MHHHTSTVIVLFSLEDPSTEEGISIGLVVPATVVPLVVLMGITLMLGIVLVYLIISKKSTRTYSLANDRTRYTNLAFYTVHKEVIIF